MADFSKAFFRTMGHEGGYVDDPNDAGGETYRGISRKYNPRWSGWDLIDDMKNQSNFPRCLDDDDELDNDVMEFYEQMYWDVNLLDEVDSQAVASEMFDTGVNMGVSRAAKFLQEALNYLNRDERSYDDLVVDGRIGPASLRALDYILSQGDEDVLLIILNVLQGQHYLNYMKKSPTQEKYARGWLKRVQLHKE
jgi:lysozyme family protein